jgi:hypothetical protein
MYFIGNNFKSLKVMKTYTATNGSQTVEIEATSIKDAVEQAIKALKSKKLSLKEKRTRS